jgi:hypothetical protein
MRTHLTYVAALLSGLGSFCMGQNGNTPAPNPCAAEQQHELSFWVGEWDLTWPGTKPGEVQRGANSIRRVLEDCVVEENFSGGDEMHLRGKSVSIFDTRAGKWKQTWVDNEGSYLDFVGEFINGQMILGRELTGPDARSPCREWFSRTFPRTNSIGVGNRPKTVGRLGKYCGQSITGGESNGNAPS